MANNNNKTMTLRKLKLQVQMSVDGYIAGPNGEMDWMVWNWDDKLKEYVNELTEPVDSILLGRKMTEGFISYWSDVMTKPDNPDYAFAKKMIEIPKVVFTKTLNKSDWVNTDIATGDLTDEINKLKSQNGKDISPIEYWMVTTGDEKEPGINGGLSKRGDSGMPNMNTIGVSSVDKFSKMVQDKGGKVVMPKTAIPEMGWFATCQDTEGNTFGIIEEDRAAK